MDGGKMHRRRRRKQSRIKTVVLSAAVIAAVLAVMVILFRIRTVEITGNEHYSTDYIQELMMPDFLSQNSLYLTWKYRSGAVEEEIPFLSAVEVKMVSPFHVKIQVYEKKLIGSFHYQDQNIYFDQKGVILEQTQEVYPDIPLITGVELGEVAIYQKIPVDDTALYQTILSLCQILSQQNLIPDEISFDENQNIVLTVQGVEAELGKAEYLEEKVSNLLAILPNLNGKSGILYMAAFTGKNESITFQEQETVEPETELAVEGENGGEEGDGGEDTPESGGEDTPESDEKATTDVPENQTPFMAFNQYGTLMYDCYINDAGVVVDGTGAVVEGATVNEDGYAVDAYMNVIDPVTGQLVQ